MTHIRKRPLLEASRAAPAPTSAINIVEQAEIGYSSEEPRHPVENMFDGRSGLGATRWIAAQADTTEQVDLAFDRPQSISRIMFDAEETQAERTQEVRVEVSMDDGQSYRQILMQQYNFSPSGATYQRQEVRLSLQMITHLRLIIVPNQNGSGTASLTLLRLFS